MLSKKRATVHIFSALATSCNASFDHFTDRLHLFLKVGHYTTVCLLSFLVLAELLLSWETASLLFGFESKQVICQLPSLMSSLMIFFSATILRLSRPLSSASFGASTTMGVWVGMLVASDSTAPPGVDDNKWLISGDSHVFLKESSVPACKVDIEPIRTLCAGFLAVLKGMKRTVTGSHQMKTEDFSYFGQF